MKGCIRMPLRKALFSAFRHRNFLLLQRSELLKDATVWVHVTTSP